MALTLQEIINEADVLVPNSNSTGDKVIWLNAINAEFFDSVKIPLIAAFTTTAALATYVLTSGVRAKGIDKVHVGLSVYRSMMFEDVKVAQNNFQLDDATYTLTLSPAPAVSGQSGLVRYHRIATSTFTSGGLSVSPDAPEEYHWLYYVALASKVARANDDMVKANNYDGEYRSGLASAAANFAKGS